MNSGVRAGQLNRWRDGLGLCCICGQIMGVPAAARKNASLITQHSNKTNHSAASNIAVTTDLHHGDNEAAAEDASNIDSDGLLLTEECPIRLCMQQFNILGERQNAHIVDDYTFLENGRAKKNTLTAGGIGVSNTKSFRDKFYQYQDTIIPLHPIAFNSFKTQVLEATEPAMMIYNSAAANCQRTVSDLTVGGCKRCNKAMDRSSMHANAVYRCFKLTQNSNNPLLETNSLTATAIKKVIQQIALYFEPILILGSPLPSLKKNSEKENEKKDEEYTREVEEVVVDVSWRAKSSDALLRDAAMWRCIAHLCCWGLSSFGDGARFRMIAIFHASYYIYERGGLKGILPFEMWHLYVWRPYYMEMYEPDTFFGMHQAEISVNFNLARQDGARWMTILHTRLQCVGDDLESKWNQDKLIPINQFISNVAKEIYDERSLVRFFCGRNGNNTENGVKKIFEFFEYNISGSNAGPQLLKRCAIFKKKLVHQHNMTIRPEYKNYSFT